MNMRRLRTTAPFPDAAGRDRIFAALSLATVYAVLLSRFDLQLLFTDTILTGGDSASWYQPLRKLKEEFLPRFMVSGYSQSNFFGYLEGAQYFPLPFLAAALAGFIMPLTVALKLATFAGGAALPASLFFSVRACTGSLRAASAASALALPFLFNESYTMFGGNWLSTFAGEFCYSWATALLPPFIASVLRDMEPASGRRRSGFASGLILGAMGLCHLFVFMPAFFLPFLPALGHARRVAARKPADPESAMADLLRIAVTYGTAFCVMGFWFVPMIATRRWAQPISMIWRFASLREFARQTAAFVWAPSFAVFAVAAFAGNSRGTARSRGILFAYALAACAFLFAVAPGMGMPDIRFVPTALLLCAFGLAALSPPKRWAIPIGILLASASLAVVMSHNAPAWFRWNYSGYEAKQQWNVLREISDRYAGTADSGRILWEKQDQRDNADFGSERAFENLELFTGRPSSEGIHYGSSFMARAATYLQSSYSRNPVDPEAERIYSIVDPDSWTARFRQVNAKHIVTHSAEITALFDAHPDFAFDARIGKFSVFTFLRHRNSYVEILDPRNLSIVRAGPGSWRTDYYRYFRDHERYPAAFLSSEFANPADPDLAALSPETYPSYDAFAAAAGRAPRTGGGPDAATAADGEAISGEHVDDHIVRFTTRKPGVPHIVKMAYAPGWKSDGGERLYPVAPGFILLVPRGTEVTLRFGRTGWDWAGLALTLAGTAALARYSHSAAAGRGAHGRTRGIRWKPLLLAGMVVFTGSTGYLATRAARGPQAIVADIGKARRLDLAVARNRRTALALTQRWTTPEALEIHDNMLTFDAFRIRARALYLEGETSAANRMVETLRARYPHARATGTLPELP